MTIARIFLFITALCINHQAWSGESDCPWDKQNPRYATDPRCVTGSGTGSASLESLSIQELSQKLQELTNRMRAGDKSAAREAMQVQQLLQSKISGQFQPANRATSLPTINSSGKAPDPCQDPTQKSTNYAGCCFPNEKFSSTDLAKGIECKIDTRHSKNTQYYKMKGGSCFYRQDLGEGINIQKFNLATTYLKEYQWQGPSCRTSFSENNSREGLDLVSKNTKGAKCQVTKLEVSLFAEKTGDCNCKKDSLKYRNLSKGANPLAMKVETLNFEKCNCQQCSPKQ